MPKAARSPAPLTADEFLDKVGEFLSTHGERATTALLIAAYESHQAACDMAAIATQDALNALPDSAQAVLTYMRSVANLRLEGATGAMRAWQLRQPVGLEHLRPKLEDLARERREAARVHAGEHFLVPEHRSVQ